MSKLPSLINLGDGHYLFFFSEKTVLTCGDPEGWGSAHDWDNVIAKGKIYMLSLADSSDGGVFSIQKWILLVAAPGALFLLLIRIASGNFYGVPFEKCSSGYFDWRSAFLGSYWLLH